MRGAPVLWVMGVRGSGLIFLVWCAALSRYVARAITEVMGWGW
jgi:hypothetical protein